jgi:hypothetical protein
VFATNLKKRRMYNLSMSHGTVLLDTLRHILNYEKIIIASVCARGNDDVDNKARDEMTRKMGTGQTEQPLIPEYPGYCPKLKFLQDLSIRIKAMVTKGVVVNADQ